MAEKRDMTFGVEIETEGRTPHHVMRAVVNRLNAENAGTWTLHETRRYNNNVDPCYCKAVDPQGREWVAKTDGSLRGENCELVTPPLTERDFDTLRSVVRAIRYSGAGVSERCGLHVHIGGRLFDGNAVANLANLCFSNEPLIYRALGIGTSRNQWAAPVPERAADALERSRTASRQRALEVWHGSNERGRYHGMNLNALGGHGTIEFRYFAGTLHSGKIRAYVLLAMHLAMFALNTANVPKARKRPDVRTDQQTFEAFLAEIGFDRRVREYRNPVRHLTRPLVPATARR